MGTFIIVVLEGAEYRLQSHEGLSPNEAHDLAQAIFNSETIEATAVEHNGEIESSWGDVW